MARSDESVFDASGDQDPRNRRPDDGVPEPRTPDIRLPDGSGPDIHLQPRRMSPIVRVMLPIVCFVGVLGPMATLAWFANAPAELPPVPKGRAQPQAERIVQPAPQVPKFRVELKGGAKVPWVAVADPQPGPAAPPLAAGDRPLAPLAKFVANPVMVTEPESRIVLALEKHRTRKFSVLDLATGQTRARVQDDQVVCFDSAGKHLVRARPNRFEIFTIDDDKAVARVSQGRVGGPVTGELAGTDKLLVRIELGGFERRHVVWDWTKDRLLLDRRIPDRQNGFGASALSPGGRYFVTIGHAGENDDPLSSDELVVVDLQTGIVAGRTAVDPPEEHQVGFDDQPQGQCWAALAFSPDGRRLGAVRSDGVLHIWDWTTGTLLRTTRLDDPGLFLRGCDRRAMAFLNENEPVLVAGSLYSPMDGSKLTLPKLGPGRDIVSYPSSGRVVAIVKDPEDDRVGAPPPRWIARVVAFDPAAERKGGAD